MTLTQRLFLLVTIALLPAVVIQAYNEFDLRRSREQEVRELAVAPGAAGRVRARPDLRRRAQPADRRRGGALGAGARYAGLRRLPRARCSPGCPISPRSPCSICRVKSSVARKRRAGTCASRIAPTFRRRSPPRAFVIGEYTEGRVALRPVLPLALPLRDTAGAVIGVVAAALDLRWLTGQLQERGLAKGGSVTVADRNGVILARDPHGGAVRRHAHTRPVPAARPRHAPGCDRAHQSGWHAARAGLRAALDRGATTMSAPGCRRTNRSPRSTGRPGAA